MSQQEFIEEQDAKIYQAVVNALGGDATTEEVQAKVKTVKSVQQAITLEDSELAKLIVEAGPEACEVLDKVFGGLTDPGSLRASSIGQSLESIMAGDDEVALEDLDEGKAFGAATESFPKLTCCGREMKVGKENGFTALAVCPSCHEEASPTKLKAIQARELDDRIKVLEKHFAEQNPTSEYALTGKSLEETMDDGGEFGLSARSLEDVDRAADSKSLEEIFEEGV